MSATTWFLIAIIGFSLSGVALITAIFMFIKMNIPAVIGDLTGKTVARQIKAMRDANGNGPPTGPGGQTGDSVAKAAAHASKRLDSSHSAHLKKGATDQTTPKVLIKETVGSHISPVDTAQRRETDVLVERMETDVLTESPTTDVLAQTPAAEVDPAGWQTEVLSETRETEILSETRQTEVLPESGETELLSETGETEVLSEPAPAAGTMVLDETEEVVQVQPVAFKITRSVTMIHTDEVIDENRRSEENEHA